MPILFILCLKFSICNCFSQNVKIDSIITVLKTDKQDTNKLIHLVKLSIEYNNLGMYDKGILSNNSALELSNFILKQTSDINIRKATQKWKANSYNNMGISYKELGNYPEALKNYFAAAKLMESIQNQKGAASAYNNIGNVYSLQGDYSESLKNHFTSLNIKKLIGDRKGVAASYNNIGNVYFDQGRYEDALKSHKSSLNIKEEVKDERGKISSYSNIGLVNSVIGNYSEALENYFAALKMALQMSDKKNLAVTYTNIGDVYRKQNKFKQGKEFLLKGQAIAQDIGQNAYLKEIHRLLSKVDSADGNFKGAYDNHKFYALYSDSLDNEETRKQTIQSQMTYDFEKKEAVAEAEHKKELQNQDLLAEERSRKQKLVILFVVSGLLLVIVFAGFIFRSLQTTRKQKHIIEIQKETVERQKLEVENQKIIVEEHRKDMIDSITYARRIQMALLPSERYIDKNLKRLKIDKK